MAREQPSAGSGPTPDDRWEETLAGPILRPVQWSTLLVISRAPCLLYSAAAIGSLILLGVADHVRSVAAVLVGVVLALLVAAAIALAIVTELPAFRRATGVPVLLSILGGGALVTLLVAGFGPGYAVVLVGYPSAVIFSVALLRLPWALLAVGLVGAESAVLFAVQDGWTHPVGQWIVLMITTTGIAATAGLLAARTISAADSERTARRELADLNATLRERVDAQVRQLERATGLRRFLAPQVADAVLAGDDDGALRPHRRKVAVFFCDLRGFTAFTARVEPEDVIDVLGEYYRAVGHVLRGYDATVGGFAGDGVMAYLNDPAPCDEPAATAVRMACEVREALTPVIARWRRLGFDLGMGIGVAVGHATLGVVGYEGRNDYTALGTVVNLAARLCDAAHDGQVLVDLRTADELPQSTRTEPVRGLVLKGFPEEMEIRAVM